MSDDRVSGPLPTYRTRLDVLFAAEAPYAVVLRRGPRKLYRLIGWNTNADTFEPGQFLHGDVTLCDLSPNGRKLLTFVKQYNPPRIRRTVPSASEGFEPLSEPRQVANRVPARANRRVPRYLRRAGLSAGQVARGPARPLRDTWTAISTPPYFSALAFWPAHGTWTGGGVFLGNETIELQEHGPALAPIENVPMRGRLLVLPAMLSRAVATKRSATTPHLVDVELKKALFEALIRSGFRWIEWVATHAKPDVLFAADGRIFRICRWSGIASEAEIRRADELIDLRDMPFETIAPPPEAMRW
jgi:hypothetical protein